MADEENNIKKTQENQEDIVAGEEESRVVQPEQNLQEAEENLRQEIARAVDEDEKPVDTKPPENIVGHEPKAVGIPKDSQGVVKMKSFVTSILGLRPIIIILVIGVIVLGVFLLYTVMQLSNESSKTENYNAFWNQSLADLKSGNITLDEYCNNRVHDEEFCNRFSSLQYMG